MMGGNQRLDVSIQPERLRVDQLKADCDAPLKGGVFSFFEN